MSHVVVKWVYFIHVQSMFKVIGDQPYNRKVRRGYSVINSDGGYVPKERRPIRYVAVERPAVAVFFFIVFHCLKFSPIFPNLFFSSTCARL